MNKEIDMNLWLGKGRLGADPELRYTQDGRPVTNFNMATNERWTDKKGERQERTEWHRIVVFGNRAETVSQYLHKGSQILVQGRLQTRKYNDKDGIERQATEVLMHNFEFCDPRRANDTASANKEVPVETPTEEANVSEAIPDLDGAAF
jgi:single-strand DNA-binding protein